MNIVVCVKQTPASANLPIDLATGRIKTEGLQLGVNPFDEYAIEEALRLKERLPGSSVSVLSFGAAAAEEALRSALALGCDEGILLYDPAFEQSDSLATAHLLCAAVRKLSKAKGAVALVLCGKQTNDGESGQVGAALGAWLDWPAASCVKKIPQADDSKIVVERLMEDGVDTVELPLPAVVSVIKGINEPRLPSLKGKMAAKKAVVARWGQAELAADVSQIGASSASVVVKTAPPETRSAGMTVPGGSPEEKAAFLVQKLKELKFI
ncbi:MAG: electron transfer flavoprotein subunit beta/FixA family protein [Elusimicrobia bacterium]|nr:electron transfer flavoprotein subunit beta/FixA family protein [Elusimicrobiota bacterium]